VIHTVIFDYGGVISGPLFVGIGAFEESEGYAKGSLLELLFGETHYIGVEGRAVAAEVTEQSFDAVAADPDAVDTSGETRDEPDWHLLEKGRIDIATYFQRVAEKAPQVLGRELDMSAYGRFWRSAAPGVHWMVVHKMRELKQRGLKLGLLTNNVKEFGEQWRATFPIELIDEVVDSSDVGLRKPEPEIYEVTCQRLAIRPEQAVFVDDNVDNVAAAQAFGMEVVHFGDDPWRALEQLDAILERRGIGTRQPSSR
jgi:putative hydrolase of the HAD superfamily